MNEGQKLVTDYMEMILKAKSTMEYFKKGQKLHYSGLEDFLKQHGVWYEVCPFPHGVKRGAPKSCFGNAILLAAMKGYKYVEGLALADGVPMPVLHAWNLDAAGNLIDNTWMNTGKAYLGVEFSLGRAVDAVWFDDCCVLDNMGNNFDIFKYPWTGEIEGLKWRKSREVEALVRATRALAREDIKAS